MLRLCLSVVLAMPALALPIAAPSVAAAAERWGCSSGYDFRTVGSGTTQGGACVSVPRDTPTGACPKVMTPLGAVGSSKIVDHAGDRDQCVTEIAGQRASTDVICAPGHQLIRRDGADACRVGGGGETRQPIVRFD